VPCGGRVLIEAAPVILHGQPQGTRPQVQLRGDFSRVRMPQSVGQRFLQAAKREVFHVSGQAAYLAGNVQF